MTSRPVIIAVAVYSFMLGAAATRTAGQSIDEVLTSGPDLWGETALRQPDGPTYDYFARLLPPLRYVEAPFRVYPIVLGAPAAPTKVRLLGNGSALNALARQPNWRGETGTPLTVRVGRQNNLFGAD